MELLFERNTIKDDGFASNDVESFALILASKVYYNTKLLSSVSSTIA